jgi:protein arginine N-methyltransferase 7
LVESTFLWKLHDLSNNEEEASDGIRLVPAGLDTILRVKAKQHPMHCDAISKEINLVMTLVTILLTSSRGKLL